MRIYVVEWARFGYVAHAVHASPLQDVYISMLARNSSRGWTRLGEEHADSDYGGAQPGDDPDGEQMAN